MKQVDEMPTSGQFVAVWVLATGDIFSDTLLWMEHWLYSYQEDIDDYSYKPERAVFYKENNAKYFVAE